MAARQTHPSQPHGVLAGLEARASATPHDSNLWAAALDELLSGRASDDEPGAAASMKGAHPLAVAVVTAYFREDLGLLRRCHDSVLAQSYPCRHIMVADGEPRDEIDDWDVEHLRLAGPSADCGDTPRAAGGGRACDLGLQAIAYLDADNSFRPHHVESLVFHHVASGAAVVFSGRTWHFPDGRLLLAVDPADGRSHIDTSCMFITGELRAMAHAWLDYPRPLSLVGDRIVFRIFLGRGLRFACTGALTLRYCAHFRWMYEALRLPVPADARPKFDPTPAARYCRSLSPGQWSDLTAKLGYPAVAFLRDLMTQLA